MLKVDHLTVEHLLSSSSAQCFIEARICVYLPPLITRHIAVTVLKQCTIKYIEMASNLYLLVFHVGDSS